MYQQGMAMLEAAGAMQEALQAPELTQQFRRFRAEGCAPALMSRSGMQAACACLFVVTSEAAGAMHGALQVSELNHVSRTLVAYALACLSCQPKMACDACRECTRLSVHYSEQAWHLGAGALAMGRSGGESSSQQGVPRSSTMRMPL